MSGNDLELLDQFTRHQSQDAFTALVNRHLNLVYSAALRQVRSPQLAEEVAQTVFLHLACHAAKLKPDTILSAWLYQVTRHAAVDVVRREARRQAREQIALQMSAMNETATDWVQIEPLLDEAMEALEAGDRAALLLRYFENKSLREVGTALGTSEDAAQKRVSRALERLRECFAKRKLTVGASGLAVLVSAHAVQAAPAGLAGAIAGSAVLGSAAISTSTAITLTKALTMTTTQKIILLAVVAAAVATGVYEARQTAQLRAQVQTLTQRQAQQQDLTNQLLALERERDRATNAVAALSAQVAENAAQKTNANPVLKLRGEVSRLRRENAELGAATAISKVTANPAARKMLRDQQKVGMGAVYKTFAQSLKLDPGQTEKLNDTLADDIMTQVDLVTTALRDKPTPEQLNQTFAQQQTALEQQLQELLGPDGLAQYRDYTKNLLSTLTADQFKAQLAGSEDDKAQKAKQLSQVMQEETQAALASAELPADYQVVPMLNLRNIASEQQGEQSLKLLDDIFQRAATRAGSFLTPDELTKFQEFRNKGVSLNRASLTLNRTFMAPIGQ